MADGFYWDFVIKDDSDYKILLRYVSQNKLFQKLLNKTKTKLEKKRGIKLPEGVIERFEIPKEQKKYMIPLLTRATKKNIKLVMNKVKKDGIICTSSKVLDAHYNKLNTNEWEIKVFVEGQYREK